MSFKLNGFKNLAQALDALPKEIRKTTEKAALRAGAKPILTAAQARVPQGENGLLKKSLGITVRKNRSGKLKGENTARIGSRSGFAITGGTRTRGKNAGKAIRIDPAKYAHLVEFGTSHSPAQPFIRPAADSSGSQVIEAMAQGYSKGLDRAVKKLRK